MKALLFIAPIAGAISVIAVGCSTAAPPPPDQTVTEFCSDWAKAYCQVSTVCGFDATACATNQTAVCNQFAETALASGTRAYNQPNGSACITLLNNTFGGNPSGVSSSVLALVNTACESAFIGSVPQNSACTSTYDCVAGTGVVCAPLVGGSGSVCGTVTDKALGQACADPGDECQGASYCAPSTTGGAPTCAPTPGPGGACSTALPCGAGYFCAGDICVATLGIGATCSSDADCQSGFCDLYPPAACETGITFGPRGSYDCTGILGNGSPITTADAGVGTDSGSTIDSGNATDSGSTTDSGSSEDSGEPTDAPTGG